MLLLPSKKLPYVLRYLVLNKVIFEQTSPRIDASNKCRCWIAKNEINTAASIRVNTVLIKIFSRQVQRLFEGGVSLNVGHYQELYLLQYYYFPC